LIADRHRNNPSMSTRAIRALRGEGRTSRHPPERAFIIFPPRPRMRTRTLADLMMTHLVAWTFPPPTTTPHIRRCAATGCAACA
jgi:hypothetical protein